MKSFTSLFEFLLENKTVEEDIITMRLILNSFATFALSNELTVVIQSKWSELLFRLLLLLAIKIKDLKDTKEQKKLFLTKQLSLGFYVKFIHSKGIVIFLLRLFPKRHLSYL